MKQLSYAQMRRVIEEGGSVLFRDDDGERLIDRIENLPTKAQLTKSDPVAAAQTADELDAQIAALQAQRASLSNPTVTLNTPATGEAGQGETGTPLTTPETGTPLTPTLPATNTQTPTGDGLPTVEELTAQLAAASKADLLQIAPQYGVEVNANMTKEAIVAALAPARVAALAEGSA